MDRRMFLGTLAGASLSGFSEGPLTEFARAQGLAMKGGQFFPKENPDDTAVLVKKFVSA